MNVLVAGGAGYIGSHVCKQLALSGHTPIVYDNLSLGHRWAVKWGPLVEGDLADSETIVAALKAHKIEAVMHFAAFINVGESMQLPGKYFRNNFANAITLLDAMVAAQVPHIVFSSTAAVYGDPVGECAATPGKQAVPIPETHPKNPVNTYGDSKLFVERALHWYGEIHGLTSAALRYFNAAGADPDGEIGEDHAPETHLIPLIIQAAQGRRARIDVYGTDYPTPDGTAIRDYIHVNDLADAHIRAVNYLKAGGASTQLNLGTGIGLSVRDVIAQVSRTAGRPVPAQDCPRRAGDPPSLVAAAGKSLEVLGWRARHSDITEIVETAWRWHSR
jgi:UDP-glucose-4-epimerase GalE